MSEEISKIYFIVIHIWLLGLFIASMLKEYFTMLCIGVLLAIHIFIWWKCTNNELSKLRRKITKNLERIKKITELREKQTKKKQKRTKK